ncbi:hypothetical protein [Runella zeae]|uniref:hypothetical protein n=1 Tax=Runella zeae TaxID=94255 RepID=UPI00041F84E4|nr:hypothetical protein [Runella zeae]
MPFLQAGPFRLLYQNGFVRQITHEGTEVLRMIYFALRDHNWGTFATQIIEEKIDTQENHFSISYLSYNIDKNQVPVFEWKAIIEGHENGTIVFNIEGKALQSLRKNRAGFCILHPIEGIAEQPVTIFHPSGASTATHFPRYISPQDPFLDIQSMQWQAANGCVYKVDCEGDIFQTEDQRNWGDASYKTFCTPLSEPFPVQLQQGDTVWQRVSFRLATENKQPQSGVAPQKSMSRQEAVNVGIAAAIETDELSAESVELLKTLKLSHYRVDLTLFEKDWISYLSDQAEKALLLGLPLEVVVTLNEDFESQLADFIGVMQQNRLHIKHLLLLSARKLVTSQSLIDYIPQLKTQLFGVKIGIGTDYNFTELNRNRFEAGEADFVSCSFDPQEHAFDELSLLENTETVKYLVESAYNIYQKPVHISFIALCRRANPYATQAADMVLSIENQIDKRQSTAFAKEWTAKLLSHLAHTEVASVTMFRTIGELGIMSKSGSTYPVFEALKER